VKALRALAVIVALTLMLGEAYRSWGVGRPVYAWIDDQIMGAVLIVGAVLMARPSPQRHAMFTAAWAFNAGMLYPSFFGKLFDPSNSNPGNFSLGFLTLAVGLLFFLAIMGTVASVKLASADLTFKEANQ
jgi:hypothetical protein